VRFDERAPICATVTFCDQPGITLSLEGPKAPGPVQLVTAPSAEAISLDDPYALPKSVLIACGLGDELPSAYGIHLHAWSNLPRGSGLGGSSILAAAMVEAVTAFCQSENHPQQTMHRVLTVEQLLSTGGGWQDQLGGLLPGAKLLSSVPVSPLRVDIQPLPLDPDTCKALEKRLLIIDTGITRLAKNVLQRVVGGYLSRRYHATRTFRRLAAVAEQARDALGSGDLDSLSDLIAETWKLNQTLDPHCSNPAVDEKFRDLPGAWKLTGAGGGGFAIWLIPANLEPDTAKALAAERQLKVVDWHIA
jgi:fucokinase